MTKREKQRKERLLPDGKPRYIRVYDNGGKTKDRYTIVFTGNYKKTYFWHLSMSSDMTVCISFNGKKPLDTMEMFNQTGYWFPPKIGQKHPLYGKRISFDDLPERCRKAVKLDYYAIWRIS